ncbi:RDD family protein [Novosphingobium colocasiae]|uniref:RDD domain-containing protein n=1 Tax=Novosphingobium colocasiae TaxID=1256513 RepID=A0A918PGF0_9SPHN|nr:RDD family protein [Novosphingobium colocasiae]GGZ07572.1 hypothetical protein GCM10011614_23140 [Novosphingobium colocasiae]
MVRYGGFWRRFVAALIDGFVLNVAFSIVGSIFGVSLAFTSMFTRGEPNPLAMASAMSGLSLITLALGWLYSAVMESSSLQATVGKLAVGVVVTDLTGERISFGRATGRYFAKYISAFVFMIGFIMVAFSSRKQGLHDKIAGTLVYKTRNPAEVRSLEGVFE